MFTFAVYAENGTFSRTSPMPSNYHGLQSKRTKHTPYISMKERPDWLTDIVNSAVVAGAAIKSQDGLPYEIAVWFNVDADGEFLEFIYLQE